MDIYEFAVTRPTKRQCLSAGIELDSPLYTAIIIAAIPSTLIFVYFGTQGLALKTMAWSLASVFAGVVALLVCYSYWIKGHLDEY